MIELFDATVISGYDQGFLGALLGIGASIFGGISGRKAERAVGEATAEAGRLNAQQVRERALIETTLRQREATREAGKIQTSAGASGLAGGGSAADILRESTRNVLFDVSTIKTQSELQAKVFEAEAKGALKAGKARGTAALLGGFLGASDILIKKGI